MGDLPTAEGRRFLEMIRKLASGEYRLYAPKKDKSKKRSNHKFGTFKTRAAAEQQERVIQYIKRRV
jgi:hypothetical protein